MTDPKRISAAELTQAAFSGVIAALKEHDLDMRKFPGPILCGIIAWPELSNPREVFGGLERDAGGP
jgi:hypothetical protein